MNTSDPAWIHRYDADKWIAPDDQPMISRSSPIKISQGDMVAIGLLSDRKTARRLRKFLYATAVGMAAAALLLCIFVMKWAVSHGEKVSS